MMRGYLLLEGGAEFGGRMAEADRRAIALAGGMAAPICIIPTAAAPDNNHEHAGGNGLRWFEGLGATHVQVVPLIDRQSAKDQAVVQAIRASRLIYLLGGFTHYLCQTLVGSAGWEAAVQAYGAGAVIAGSSAGAMVLCEHYFASRDRQVLPGLGLVRNSCVLPHHDTFGHRWAPALEELIPQSTLLGIDERTGMIDDGPDGAWRVYGQGAVTLYHAGQTNTCRSGETFALES